MIEKEKGSREAEIFKYMVINPIFSSLPVDKLRKLTRYFYKVDVKEGMPVFREGDRENSLYFVVRGFLDVYKKKKTGKDVKIADIKTGQSFGELSLVDNYPRSATVIAKTNCILLVLNKDNLEKLEKEEKDIAYHIFKQIVIMISRRLRETTDMLLEFSQKEKSK